MTSDEGRAAAMAVAAKVVSPAVMTVVAVMTKAVKKAAMVAAMVVVTATATATVMSVTVAAVTKTTTAATSMEWICRPRKRRKRLWQGRRQRTRGGRDDGHTTAATATAMEGASNGSGKGV